MRCSAQPRGTAAACPRSGAATGVVLGHVTRAGWRRPEHAAGHGRRGPLLDSAPAR
jgi:hypothetical protein